MGRWGRLLGNRDMDAKEATRRLLKLCKGHDDTPERLAEARTLIERYGADVKVQDSIPHVVGGAYTTSQYHERGVTLLHWTAKNGNENLS